MKELNICEMECVSGGFNLVDAATVQFGKFLSGQVDWNAFVSAGLDNWNGFVNTASNSWSTFVNNAGSDWNSFIDVAKA